MKEYLKHYQACLKAIGPVFVGNGRQISKKEYLPLNGNSRIGVLDMPAFYEFLGKRFLQRKFDDFMLDGVQSDLRSWIRNQKLSVPELNPYYKYILDLEGGQIDRKTQIMEFIKDPYYHPYIPGSTIKGMLRTILLADYIQSDRDNFSPDLDNLYNNIDNKKNRRSYLSQEIGQVENHAFHTLNREKNSRDAVNDALAGLIVSDSEPIELSSLILCQKIDVHPTGIEKTINVMRECLKPGTEIKFSITIDERLLQLSGEQIMSAVNDFAKDYNENFLSYFRGMKPAGENTVYLGGGVGFVSKTVIYPSFGHDNGVDVTTAIFRNINVPFNHHHSQDPRIGVSPHIVKCTRYQNRLYQMGQCKLIIEKA